MSDKDGKIVIDADEILKNHAQWAAGEASDASSGGTRREAIGSYADKCGIENKAFSQFRAGLKIKNEGKRQDWLRSLQLLCSVAEKVVFANQPDMLDEAENAADEGDAEEPVGEIVPDEEFDESDDDTVTPIDFGAGAA